MVEHAATMESDAPYRSKNTWIRGLFMLLYGIALGICQWLIVVIALVQFVFRLLTGEDNEQLRKLGVGFSRYVAEVTLFLTYASERKPFPMSSWPDSGVTPPPAPER